MRPHRIPHAHGLRLVLAAIVALSIAAEELPTVTVTATKRSESPARIPLSLSLVNEALLNELSPNTINDIADRIPNLHIVSFSAARLSFPYIRGIGSGQGNPAIGTYIDDIPQLSINTARMEFLSPKQVEVLRGPQGTLYGRNTLGGVILVQSQPPADVFGGSLDYEVAGDNQHRVKLRLSGPLNDEAAYALDAAYRVRDGYTENTITGNDVDSRDALATRAELRLNIDDWDVRVGVQAQRDRDGAFALYDLDSVRSNPHEVEYDFEGRTDRDVVAPFLRLERIGEQIDFVSITGFQHWRVVDLTDSDFSSTPNTQDGGRTREVVEDQDEWTQEFRWRSSDDAELQLTEEITARWLAGIYGSHSDFTQETTDIFGQDINHPQFGLIPVTFTLTGAAQMQDTGIAAFGQTTLTLQDSIDLTLGARVAHEDKHADRASFGPPSPTGDTDLAYATDSFDDSDSAVSPKIALAWRPCPAFTAFASAAKGYKSGGFNPWAPSRELVTYDSEESWTYELGVKGHALDRKLHYAATLFHVEWDDMQIYLPSTFGLFYLDNVGTSRSRGMELESTLDLGGGFQLEGSVGITAAEFTDDYDDPFAPGTSADGNSVHFAPEHTWHLGLSKHGAINQDLTGHARIDLSGVGEYAYDPTNAQKQEAYVLTHLQVGISSERWDVRAWVHNLFDEEYVPVAFRVAPGTYIGEAGAPRTVGIGLGFSF